MKEMPGSKSLLFSLFTLTATFAAGADHEVEQWRVVEIPLTSTTSYGDPFQNVDVTATFTGPGGQTITRPAFWDGGQSWKIRFAPTATGDWSMTTACTDTTNTGLHGVTTSVHCGAYTGNHEIYQRGFPKISANGRYFTYADGTPFFYLGDTHWLFVHERFDTSNVPGVPSQFKYTVDKRIAQGFTVYQSEAIHNPHGSGAHDSPTEEPHADFRDGFTEADLPGLVNMDRKFAYIADQGLLHAHAGITWAQEPRQHPTVLNAAFMARLGKYWAARFGAYPVLWTVAQEIDSSFYGEYDATTLPLWFEGAKGTADHDAYRHPIGAHLENLEHMAFNPARSTWKDKPYHQWWPIQMQGDLAGHRVRNFYDSTPTKPMVMYEAPYENFWTDTKGARGAGYKAFQWGMCGYGYGAAGVWNDIYAPGDYGTDYQMPQRYVHWHDGANLAGGAQMTFLKDFYTSLEWWKFEPRFDNAAWSAFAEPNRSLLSSDGNQSYVVYFFGAGKSTGILRGMAAVPYEAHWFDPRTGTRIEVGGLMPTGGQCSLPERPSDDDWVLLVKQTAATVVPAPATGSRVSASQTTVSWNPVGLPSGLTYQVRFGDEARYDVSKPHGNLYLLTPAGGITGTTCKLPAPLVPGTIYYWMLSVTQPSGGATTDYTFSFTAAGAGSAVSVENGSFETSGATTNNGWARLPAAWNPAVTNDFQQNNLSPSTSAHFTATSADGGSWYALMNNNTTRIHQDLNAWVNAGDTISVTFQAGRARTGVSTSGGGIFNASFVVGTTPYSMPVDTTAIPNNEWRPFTLTRTITTSGRLSLEFSATSGNPWLDNIGAVTITPAPTLSVAVDAPTENQRITSGSAVNATATVANGTGPYSVSYEISTPGGARTPVGSSSTPPYQVSLGNLADGTYELWATATDQGAGSASVVSTPRTFLVTPVILIPVENGSFESTGVATNGAWARIHAGWNPGNTANAAYQENTITNTTSRHLSSTPAGGGSWYALMGANTVSISRDLGATVQTGDKLAVSFYAGRGGAGLSTAAGGVFKAELIVGTTVYEMNVDTTAQPNDSWQRHTLERTITNSGNLSIRFSAVSGDPWLDHIGPVERTPAEAATSSFESWMNGQPGVPSGMAGFSDDADGDGVVNGLVWMLGGTSVMNGGRTFLPIPTANTDGSLTLVFQCLASSQRGSANVQVQYSNDAINWLSAAVPENSSVVSGVDFTITGDAPKQVSARIPKVNAADTRLLGRVQVVK